MKALQSGIKVNILKGLKENGTDAGTFQASRLNN